MAKFNVNKKKSGGSIEKLKFVVEKLHKKLLQGKNKTISKSDKYEEQRCESTYVPEDVKEGHFAVIAECGKEEEPKRFVLPLSCLTNPIFVRLLEQAEEEYGFDHEGALTIPCKPSHLEMMLEHQWRVEKTIPSWISCNNSMVF